MTGYYDIWHAVKKQACNAVDKDKKGVTFALVLKPFKKVAFDLKRAEALAMEAIESTKTEKTIPLDMEVHFHVYGVTGEEMDAAWIYGYVMPLVEKIGNFAGSKRLPGIEVDFHSGRDRYVEIMIKWREIGEFGGLHGILF